MYRGVLTVLTILVSVYMMAIGFSIVAIASTYPCPTAVSFIRNVGSLFVLIGLYGVVKSVKKFRARDKSDVEQQAVHAPESSTAEQAD
jgi:hypothetical protein